MIRFFIIFLICSVFYIVFNLTAYNNAKKRKEKLSERFIELHKELGRDYFTVLTNEIWLHKQDPRIAEYIKLRAYNPKLYSTTPKELVYTGATVGGVTTGGFHTVGGETISSQVKTHRFEMLFYDIYSIKPTVEWKMMPIKKISLSKELVEKAQKNSTISKYLDVKNREIIVKEETKISTLAFALYKTGRQEASANQMTLDNIDTYPDMDKCKAIMDFICGVDDKNTNTK